MTASAAVAAATAMGTATATVAAAADLSLVVDFIIYNIPYGQTYAAKYNNCRNYCCHDLIPFLFPLYYTSRFHSSDFIISRKLHLYQPQNHSGADISFSIMIYFTVSILHTLTQLPLRPYSLHSGFYGTTCKGIQSAQ